MEKELEPVVIKATQSSLGKYVKRPPLTEKLLKKPPFRFLHDIITSVLKTTGFFEGLFDEEELVSENVKDRENKIVFLNKVITVVGLTTGKQLAAKPSKIVAGQEPDKTNELLQCIAHALDKNLSSDEAVRKFKEGLKLTKSDGKKGKEPPKQTKKASENNKLTSKSNEKLTNSKKAPGIRSSKNDNDKKTQQKDKSSIKQENTLIKPLQSKLVVSKKTSVEKKKYENSENTSTPNDIGTEGNILVDLDIANNDDDSKLNIEYQSPTDTAKSESGRTGQDKQNHHNNSYTIEENCLNSSLSSHDHIQGENIKTDGSDTFGQNIDLNGKMTRPINQNISNSIVDDNDTHTLDDDQEELSSINKSSSNETSLKKPDLNKTEEKDNDDPSIVKPIEVKAVVRPLSVRPSSSRPGAPRPRDKHDNILSEAENVLVGKVNIITESSPNEEEEDTSIVIVEQNLSNTIALQDDQEKLQTSLNEHGHLVQQILDSQKEYSKMSGKTEIEWQFGAQKARDALNKEIEQLRFDIQALSRIANPLGKLLDHIQEDVEVMRQELNQWTKTYEETSKELYKQKAVNEDSLFPLYAKVKQLGTDIEEKHDKINDLKIIIHKNSLRIDKLLTNGNVQ